MRMKARELRGTLVSQVEPVSDSGLKVMLLFPQMVPLYCLCNSVSPPVEAHASFDKL